MSKKTHLFILSAAVAGFVAAVMALAAWKWSHAAYNGMDLAYFSQAVWNTVHGRLFAFTIHPGLTLGDHAEWALILLAIPYALAPHPLVLVLLQTLALAASSFVVLRIAGRMLPPHWALATAITFLLLPTVGGAALFEFHILVFALPLLLLSADAYLEKRFIRFLLFLGLALLVREDVALVTFCFGIVALIDRRSKRWIIAPMAASAVWFVVMMYVIRQFSIGGYKFFAYYAWLWPLDPVAFLRHITQLTQVEFLLGLLMPMLLLPLVRPKWLVLAIPVWLELLLSASGAGAVLLQTHYVVLLLPGVVLASLDGLAWARKPRPYTALPAAHVPRLIALVLVTATIFSAVTLGPFTRGALLARRTPVNDAVTRALRMIPSDASVAASERFLPHLANRETLLALRYVMLGTTQFGAAPYDPPAPDVIIYDESDLLAWHANFPTLSWTRDRYEPGFGRLRQLIDRGGYGMVFRDGGVTVWQRGASRPRLIGAPEQRQEIAPGIRVAAVDEPTFCPARTGTCPLLVFTAAEQRTDDLLLRLTPAGRAPQLMSFGLVPTFSWNKNSPVTLPATVLASDLPGSVSAELVNASGDLTLDALGTAVVSWTRVQSLGPAVTFTLR